jgi:hypothetical protein
LVPTATGEVWWVRLIVGRCGGRLVSSTAARRSAQAVGSAMKMFCQPPRIQPKKAAAAKPSYERGVVRARRTCTPAPAAKRVVKSQLMALQMVADGI